MPKLKVIEDNSLNAFATGMNEKQYSITVTSGLVNSLDDAELEAVLGHELTHIRNGDVRMLVIAVVIAGAIAFFAELVFRLMFQGGLRWRSRGGGDRKGAGVAILIAVALVAVAWILSIVIRFALSRKREYLADAGSVELTKNPDAMISALRKIEGRSELEGATSAVMEMCIDNPRVGFSNIFDTHPPQPADRPVAGARCPGRRATTPVRWRYRSRRSHRRARSRTTSSRQRGRHLVLRPDLGAASRAVWARATSPSCRSGRRSSSAVRHPQAARPVHCPAPWMDPLLVPGARIGNRLRSCAPAGELCGLMGRIAIRA